MHLCRYLNKKSSGKPTNYVPKKLATFRTVEGFWEYYSHLVRPNELPVAVDYQCFREGIVPLWEVGLFFLSFLLCFSPLSSHNLQMFCVGFVLFMFATHIYIYLRTGQTEKGVNGLSG